MVKMQPWWILFLLAVLLGVDATARQAVRDDGFNVGISLSSVYATVSAHISNGSYIDIAKIEGGEDYRMFMLGMPELGRLHIAEQPSFWQRVWRRLPSQSVSVHNPLFYMLKAAVAAAETSLETSISSVAVSVYDSHLPRIESVKLNLKSALETLGLTSWTRSPDYGYYLIPAVGIEGICSDGWTTPDDPNFHEDPPRLVLTLDYTRASMTGALWYEECGVVEMLSWMGFRIFEPLGLIDPCDATKGEYNLCADKVDFMLSALCSESEETQRMCEERWPLSAVLITGERADDKAMTAGLRRFLRDNFNNGSSMPLSGVQEYAPDPAFAASRAAARFERVLKVVLADEQDERSEL